MWGSEGVRTFSLTSILEVAWFAVALTLIFGLEVWKCVLLAGLFVWAVEAGGF